MTRRQKAIGFFVALGVLLVTAAVSLNVTWIMTERRVVALVLGIVLFAFIIAGLIIYTVFLVMEIKRNEEHDSFINAVTHELKTPIASIRLYLQTLQAREVSEEKRREFYDIMLADATRLHDTVDQVLKAGMARERARGQASSVVDVAALTRECVDLATVRHHLPPGAIDLQSHDASGLTVRGDSEQLRTVLANLLDNAVKYSGGRAVRLYCESEGDRIAFSISDEGPGISAEDQRRIFQKFVRGASAAATNVKGTGLGLAMVKLIVSGHGGEVRVSSQPDAGSTFTVVLPAQV
jgi:signal transduction histidine kinase